MATQTETCQSCGDEFKPFPCEHKECVYRAWDGYLNPRIIKDRCEDCHLETRHDIVDGRSLLKMDRKKKLR